MRTERDQRVVVIGAGIGGLAAAAILAARGLAVEVVERGAVPGGKLRQVTAGGTAADGRGIDSGPTVFTMPDVLRDVFREAGDVLDARVTLRRAEVLARHAWAGGDRLDLFADPERSAQAIGAFAGAGEADGFRRFHARAGRILATLDEPFMRRPAPGMAALLRDAGPRALLGIDPFRSLWRGLDGFFGDLRLKQLFGRYSTYVGSSPFAAPATLMLIAAVEQDGVWLVEGGMIRLAKALATLAARHGARFRYRTSVRRVVVERNRARGVLLDDGERLDADAVLCNADISALGGGLLGRDAAHGARAATPRQRSFSATTWSLRGRADGFPLARHTVFFSRDYPAEFAALAAKRMPAEPTIYLCAQDRDDRGARLDGAADGAEE
ncbi:MAG: FAD-dependent oxidoreductase, partial [Gluconacetobacter diazotrophicus]|nr:FAD-dependent oxidoreductase [Gluconacetobacter diazotrophicus]